MEPILENNLKALSAHQAHIPESVIQTLARLRDFGAFESVPGRRGLPTLRFTDAAGAVKHAHSLFDPERESQKRATALTADKKNVYIFAGLGLGYDAAALLPLLPLDSCIVIFEPSLQALGAAMRAVPLEPILEHPRVLLVPGADLDTYRYPLIDFLGDFPPTLFELIPAAYVDLFPGFGAGIAGILREIHDICVNVKHTRDTFLKTNLFNTARNYPLILEQAPLESLFNIFKDIPAVIIGPGPGLFKSLSALKLLNTKCALISLNTTAPFLVQNGIIPDFIVSIDPQVYTFKKAGTDLPKECTWLFPDFACSDLVSAYKNNAYVFPSSPSVQMSLSSIGLSPNIISSGPSASTASLFICQHFGFNPIGIIGIDFTLSSGKRYCWDAPFCNIFEEIESSNIFKSTSMTTNDLLAYSVEFSKIIHNINADVHDIRESGIQLMDIPPSCWKEFFLSGKLSAQFADSFFRNRFSKSSKIPINKAPSRVRNLKQNYKSELLKLTNHLSQLAQLICSMLPNPSLTEYPKDSLNKLFHEYISQTEHPLWHLFRNSYHPLPISTYDLVRTDDQTKIQAILNDMRQYILDTIENIHQFLDETH